MVIGLKPLNADRQIIKIMNIIESTKKAAKEYLAMGRTKAELIERLKKLSNVNETINYTAEYGLNKNFLTNQNARRCILKNPSLIGL